MSTTNEETFVPAGFGSAERKRDDARRPRCGKLAAAAIGGICLAALIGACIAFGPQLWGFFMNGEAQIAVAILPGEPVELAAGYLFGFWEGTAICLAGSLVGTLLVTLLVRLLGMRVVHAFFSAEQIEGVSWLRDSARFELIMFVVFLIPGTPKDILTYVAGLTTCPWWRIAAITTVGRIPSVITSTLAAGFASEGNWTAAVAAVVVAVALAVVGTAVYAVISRRAKR